MNVRKRGKDLGRSEAARSGLFVIIGHIHNLFSINKDKSQRVEEYGYNGNIRELAAANFEAEIAKIKASIAAQNTIARFQKS